MKYTKQFIVYNTIVIHVPTMKRIIGFNFGDTSQFRQTKIKYIIDNICETTNLKYKTVPYHIYRFFELLPLKVQISQQKFLEYLSQKYY